MLSGVSLSVPSGGIWALFGRNGSGKSTLLETLCGGLPSAQGSVLLDGAGLRSLSDRDRALRVAFVPQREEPAFDFTIREIAALGRLPHSRGMWESAEDWRRVDDALDQAGILDLAGQSARRVSGGELQLALIARAIAQESPILLLDEPTSNLDVERHGRLAGILRRHAAAGGCVLMASHDINWALSVADHAVCLGSGRVDWQGPAEESIPALERSLNAVAVTVPGPRVVEWRDPEG